MKKKNKVCVSSHTIAHRWFPRVAVEAIGVEILGWGNGDPGFKYLERPTATENILLRPFNGCCQLLLRSVKGASGTAELIIGDRSYPIPYLR